MRMAGKVCLVTGAAAGLGRAQAEALASEGARVVLTDVDAAGGREAAAAIGAAAIFIAHDVRDEDQWRSVIGRTIDWAGALHVLVNNAGIIEFADIETATLEGWRRVQSVNVEGCFLGIKHALPAIRASGRPGSIVNLSSTAALQGYPGAAAYSASKGAVSSLTRAVAVHCIRKGDPIRCNAVHPHNAESPMQRDAHDRAFGHLPPEHRPRLNVGSAADVAKAVLFLASDESMDLNGTALNLDRGTGCLPASLPA